MTGTLTGRGVLLWLTGFFAVVIAVNVAFILTSISTFRGEDEQDPYLQGIEYNRTLSRRATQEILGWRADLSAMRLANGHVRIAVTLLDRAGASVAGQVLTGELRHPADETRDRAFRLHAVSPGRYEADAGPAGRGDWDVIVDNESVKEPFEATRRLWVP